MFYTESAEAAPQSCGNRGLNDVTSMEHELSSYKIVAAPMAYMFKDGYEEKLRVYAENGGTLVITYWTGLGRWYRQVLPWRYTIRAYGRQLVSHQERLMLFMTGKKTMEFQNPAIIWESAASILVRTCASW